MKSFGLSLFSLLILNFLAFGQNLQKDYAADQVMNWNSKAGANISNMVMGFDEREGNVVGDYYLNENWQKGHITLKSSQELNDIPVRYDLMNHYLELKLEGNVKVLNESRIASFGTIDNEGFAKKYTNASTYRIEGTQFLGFLEVLVDGEFQLLERTYLKIKEPDYVEAFDMGSMDTKILKKTELYIGHNDQLFEIKNRNSANLAYFPQHNQTLKDYIKKNRLKFNRPDDAVSILNFYNKLD